MTTLPPTSPFPAAVAARLLDHGHAELRDAALRIAGAGLAACEPGAATELLVTLDGDALVVDGRALELAPDARVVVLGAGKATLPIAAALQRLLGERLAGGVVVVRAGEAEPLDPIEVLEADHPLPSERSLAAGRRLLEVAGTLRSQDVALCCFTGGSSALASVPPLGVSFAEKRELHRLLLRSGAPIEQVNAVRKHVSLLKGGRIAAATPARIVNLTVSDVAGNPLDAITDPTVPDLSSVGEAIAALEHHGLWDAVPASVREHLLEGDAASPPLDAERIQTVMLADGHTACRAMAVEAQALGLAPQIVSTTLTGESREAGHLLAGLAAHSLAHGTPWQAGAALVGCGGETTVTLAPQAALSTGGPNQEAALAAALVLAGKPAAALFLDTDGIDGGTPLAGGLVDGTTAARAAERGVSLPAALRDHRATVALEAVDDALLTGPTATNVNDLFVFVLGTEE
ncbi:DUF4147 domain-containing protein [Conexibacter stalactiti]|uniref:DUF4147 domain-containing protein n=1 Tax=Conexibacter stalactiti TaxID=1940611 RepID=A0ABU4HR30_9ACTN|nr:DUF4147 domain-containing protein [Conexibacter stalactiti]MDW5595737.1 DUF4147 domain-containing protein [Conexibacter stalactiti]MEC5036379.1 DUF4147 domain-containing protein [Conexibacter stalactiti]